MKYQVYTNDNADEAFIVPLSDMTPEGRNEAEASALSWRDAKKKLRAYYLAKARSLRSISERNFKQP